MELTAKYRDDWEAFNYAASRLDKWKLAYKLDNRPGSYGITITVPLKGRARFLRRNRVCLSVLGFLKPDVVEAIQ